VSTRSNFIPGADVMLFAIYSSGMKKKFIVIITSISIVLACSKSNNITGNNPGDPPLDCSAVIAKAYLNDVSPIMQTKCATDATCHGSGSTNGPGPLINYTAIFNSRTTIRAAISSGAMPKTGSITTTQRNSILCWIDSGAPNN
jgi:hypothetical protein